MGTGTVFRQSCNAMLDIVSADAIGSALPSENELGAQLGVGRTTMRKVLT